MRRVKTKDERFDEFLNVGQELFFKLGYDNTTVDHIVKKIDVAKGTFYYYFKSKADLLDKIVERFSSQTSTLIQTVVDNKSLNAIQKLNQSFNSIGNFKLKNIELMITLMKVLYRDDNLILRYKIFKKSLDLLTPLFSKIIKQGVEEKLFKVSDPYQTADLIFSISLSLNEKVVSLFLGLKEKPENSELIDTKIKLYEEAVEKILSIESGMLNFVDLKIIDRYKKAFFEFEERRK